MEEKERFEMKGALTLVPGGQRPDNVYAFPVRNKKEVICPKCGNSSFKMNCPDCGIPLKNAAYLEKVVLLFGKQLVQERKVCPACGEPTNGDICEMCGKDLWSL